MKALIVDDEKHVRDAIKLLVDWNSFGINTVLEAEDGESAMQIVAFEQPDLIFTDMMMPYRNGVELLKWLHSHSPNSKTIVISGHDDFEFVRSTVKLGGVDYILKPIDREQLEDAVNKAVTSLKETKQIQEQQFRKSMEINQFKPVFWDKMFSSLITDPLANPNINETVQMEFKLQHKLQKCSIAILSFDMIETSIREKFNSSMDLLFYALANICNEFLALNNRGFAFRYWNSESEILLLFWEQPDEIESIIHEIYEGIRNTMKARFDFGIGTAHFFPADLQLSYKEAKTALMQRDLLTRNRWIHRIRDKEYLIPTTLQLIDYEEQLRFAVRSGSETQIKAVIKDWIKDAKLLPHISMEQVELWRHEYNVLKARWLKHLFDGAIQEESHPLKTNDFIAPMDEEGRFSL
ncbi:MAG TPA: response regulator, partial [Bacilli bacterium]